MFSHFRSLLLLQPETLQCTMFITYSMRQLIHKKHYLVNPTSRFQNIALISQNVLVCFAPVTGAKQTRIAYAERDTTYRLCLPYSYVVLY